MTRKDNAKQVRIDAAELAFGRSHPNHVPNNDEAIPFKPMSFTKGLPHDYDSGLIKEEGAFEAFVKGIDTADPMYFKKTPLGPASSVANPSVPPTANNWTSDRAKSNMDGKPENVRAWESAGAGHAFDLEGPDAQAVTMPPAPALLNGNDSLEELTAEIAEVYAQALLRDVPFSVYFDNAPVLKKFKVKAQEAIDALNKLPYFDKKKRNQDIIKPENAFRGFTNGDLVGPYISQFLLTGTNGLNQKGDDSPEFDACDGQIGYGSQTIGQKVRKAKPIDHMTDWDEWFDVQNGADFRGQEAYVGDVRRFITTPRDLATYVHYDALYQAYLNACIILLGANTVDKNGKDDSSIMKFDPGVPFQGSDLGQNGDSDHQQGFALYGGPHILTLVTEVATRALKAVRFQKFNTHRRLRPEALAARFHRLTEVKAKLNGTGDAKAMEAAQKLEEMYNSLDSGGCGIFDLLRKENPDSLLLPMAFVEGSPMHPTYGAGHATVAGACVTILKAFFNHELYINITDDGEKFQLTDDKCNSNYAFVPNHTGKKLRTVKSDPLKLESELNKLAANISIGRDWAGVHYYSDYAESLRLGEKVAIGLLEEQALTYPSEDNFKLTLNTFDGDSITIEA